MRHFPLPPEFLRPRVKRYHVAKEPKSVTDSMVTGLKLMVLLIWLTVIMSTFLIMVKS